MVVICFENSKWILNMKEKQMHIVSFVSCTYENGFVCSSFRNRFLFFWNAFSLNFWPETSSNQIANWRNTEHIWMVYYNILYPNDAHFERISGVLGNFMHLSRCMEKDVQHCPPFWDSYYIFRLIFHKSIESRFSSWFGRSFQKTKASRWFGAKCMP